MKTEEFDKRLLTYFEQRERTESLSVVCQKDIDLAVTYCTIVSS